MSLCIICQFHFFACIIVSSADRWIHHLTITMAFLNRPLGSRFTLGFLPAPCHPVNSINALNETQSTDLNHGKQIQFDHPDS